MYTVSSTIRRILIASALYQRGIGSSIPFEKGQLAIKAVKGFDDEVIPFNEANKLKAEAYNAKLETERKEWKGEGEYAASSELIKEREEFTKGIEDGKKKPIAFEMGDDKLKALVEVCQGASKAWYKAVQEKNECADPEKQAKIPAPSLEELDEFIEFISDLENADRVKTK